MAISNPFPLTGYHGPEYFCDRETETEKLVSNALNGVNSTLLSVRRMGKTILIRHVFEELTRKRKAICLYIDIHATLNQKELLKQLATALLQNLGKRKTLGKKIMEFVTGLRPVISYDNLTGQPEVSFDWQSPRQQEQSLQSLFQFLDVLDSDFVIAIDEFQQISAYPEANTESLLRSMIQPLKNIRFIFSGSSRHLLQLMFAGTGRPFYGSTQLMELKAIDEEPYRQFILHHFQQNKRKLEMDALEFILSWTRRHTWFTQVLCNRLFAGALSPITLEITRDAAQEILKEQEAVFFQYRNLLTLAQWQMLKAVAQEEKLYQPGARSFLQQYQLGTPSHTKRSLESLLEKEMVYQDRDEKGDYYQVYDCFLARWLQQS